MMGKAITKRGIVVIIMSITGVYFCDNAVASTQWDRLPNGSGCADQSFLADSGVFDANTTLLDLPEDDITPRSTTPTEKDRRLQVPVSPLPGFDSPPD